MNVYVLIRQRFENAQRVVGILTNRHDPVVILPGIDDEAIEVVKRAGPRDRIIILSTSEVTK